MTSPRLLTLHPYRVDHACWVFDDPRTGLKAEAFVRGASEMISRLVEHKQLPGAECGFAMTFSDAAFAGHDVTLELDGPEAGGNWYVGDVCGLRMEGWLCPALFLYFEGAPPRIFVRCDPLPAGVEPVWTPPPGVRTRRFVEPPAAGMEETGL